MSSKLYNAERAAAEPIVWPQLGTAGAVSPGPRATSPDDGALEAARARISELERDAEARLHQAFSAGFRKGEAAGAEQAAAGIDPALKRYAEAAAELARYRRKLRCDAEEDVLKLALAIARRVLHRELQADPEALLGVVKAALTRMEAREIDRVRVHAADAGTLRRHFEQLGGEQRVEVLADPRLERGSVVIETARGTLDASVETQLDEIQRGLADRLGR
jgi:flagellar assembly protein FliH